MTDWDELQFSAQEILSQGISKLIKSPARVISMVNEKSPCNYLISDKKIPVYIGESKNASSRIKTQFNLKTSTFYKNYLEKQNDGRDEITSFQLRIIFTEIGRKEIEDFGIVNLATGLNKFQLGKRKLHPESSDCPLWDNIQKRAKHLLLDGVEKCDRATFRNWSQASPVYEPGLYLVRSKNGEMIYVGESSDIGTRYNTHSGRTYFSALRRNIGTSLLSYNLQTISGRKRYFSADEDLHVTDYLKSCSIAFVPVMFGRYELEEALITKLKPMLNRKGK